jgi:hypothetical protein
MSLDILRRIALRNRLLSDPLIRAGSDAIVAICDWLVLAVTSGRTSGVVKNTPSGVGFGVAVIAACGDPATPVRSWMRINRAKSSCTVLWQ